MTINPEHHIYNIRLTENVFQQNLFISNFSSAAPTCEYVAQVFYFKCVECQFFSIYF